MKLKKQAGVTSEIWQIFIQNSTLSTGAGLTGLVFNSAGLTAYFHRDTDTTATAITLATMTVGTYTSGGFKEIDSVNMPGWYQFCPPNAAIAAGAKSCAFHLKGATNMADLPIEVQLVAVNPDDGVRYGMTALPNAVPGAAGGVFIAGTNAATTITATSGNTPALKLTGFGAAPGLSCTGGSGGDGADFFAGASAGIGVLMQSGNGVGGVGLQIAGSSVGLFCFAGSPTVPTLQSTGFQANGISSGSGIYAAGGLPNGSGMMLSGFGTGVDLALNATGNIANTSSGTAVTLQTTISTTLLKYDVSTITGEAARSPLNALRFLRNKWVVAAGVVTVYKEDGVTTAWTGTLATDVNAAPIISNTVT